MQHYENQRNLEAEITANIENLQAFYGLDSVNSLKQLVQIILDPKKSDQLFQQRNITVSSIFEKSRQSLELDPAHIGIFASKYSFEKLVQKFPRPRGETNRMLSAILQKKFCKQVINSHQTRKNLWMLLSGARFNMIQHQGLYQQLLTYPTYPEYFTRAIKQDISRTVKKSQTSEAQLTSLQNILLAFSRRNPYVGYCQGLNFVAYFLLTMQFSQQQAFWLLSSIIETVIPMDYYTNMIGVVCDQQVFITILLNLQPQIVQKFNQVGLDPSVLSIQWFVCLFTSSLPISLVKIVWDRLLVQGPRAFIKCGIIILDYFKEQILAVNQFHEIIMLLEKGTKRLDMTQTQFNSKFQKIYISREGLVIARTLYREYHLKQKLTEKLATKKFNPEEIDCNPTWPICIVALEKNRRTREEIDVWTFRQSHPPFLDRQYLLREDRKPQKIQPIFEKDKDKEGKKKTPIKINNNVSQQSIRESQFQSQTISMSKLSMFEPKYSQYNRINTNLSQDQFKSLIIGRMHHVCGCKAEAFRKTIIKEQKLQKPVDRRSVILVESDEQKDELRRSNIFKIMQGEEQKEEYLRSQTVLFFSKFVTQNLQLSSIFVPGTKKQ